ncbi:MAG TPA: beta/gamma crystallin-related protein [Roseiflexaceae bacterium]
MKRLLLVVAVMLLGGLFLPGVPPAAQAAPALQAIGDCDGGDGVYLYDLPQYQGRCIKITGDVPDLGVAGFDNTASSMRIVGDWITSLFADTNYGGASSFFTGSDSNLSNNTIGDNRASSVGARRGTKENLCDGSDGVYLYDQTNYRGRCARVTDSYTDLGALSFDDVVSSIRLVGNYVAALYVDRDYGGASSFFDGDDADLADNRVGDNRASSIGVSRGGGTPQANRCDGGEGVYLYEHPNYQGRCAKFTADAPDLRTLNFDDIASSIRIQGNWTVTLYRDLSGTGVASTFTQDNSNLAGTPVGDNQVTSVRVQRGGPSGNACDGGEGVYLYEHPNYQGRCVKFTADAPDLRVYGFDDIASSVRVVGSWRATLYRDLSGTGVSSTFTQDDSNLANDSVGDNQVTSVRARRR